MKRINKVIFLGSVFILLIGLNYVFAGKYENIKTVDERKAEMRAKNLSSLKRNIGRQFYAQPITNPSGRVEYPEIRETAQIGGRYFRVLEKEDFIIKEFIVGEIKTSINGDSYRRRVIFKIQFKSGKVGFVDLADLALGGTLSQGYIYEFSNDLQYLPDEKCIIAPKSRDPELDGALKQMSEWKYFREDVW